MTRETTRFAPSPTGHLHLGHAFSALNAYRRARDSGGRFLLRIEDIDRSRCREEFESAILDDLAWLGLDWETPVRRQSEHFDDYRRALEALDAQGLLYPCFCTRKVIAREVARAGLAPHGADGPRYSGVCLALSEGERAARIAGGAPYALRLKAQEALRRSGSLVWHDEAAGEIAVNLAALEDAVLARKDIPASYHLAVVIDDALQGITLITRGLDLFPATPLHRLLQALLALPVPRYHHHRLIVDDKGQRLAKRTGAATLRALRERGMSAAEASRLIGA
ncbi:MAG TPA: tRNA glutamyl-Q(34) synthetase GluQRS [Alphaproteobacteria bacterium]|nr:tRNA glutamyl-Q(34) synthetase GluQRS [Alphaproteobacteria bacterium]